MVKNLYKLVFATFALFCGSFIHAQSDSTKHQISFQVHTLATIASRDEQPLWLTSNERGILNSNTNNLAIYGTFNFKRPVFKKLELELGLEPEFRNSDAYEFGSSGSSVFLVDYYTKLRFKSFYLRLGAESRTIGQFGGELSSGSLQQSMNARPLPGITIGADYFNFPFTKGWLQAKGEFTHGWMEKERQVTNPWYHQKYGYLKLGAKWKYNLEFGITHFSIWGGEYDGRTASFIFSDFFKVVTGGLADPSSSNVGSNDTFVFGGHHGTIDLAGNFAFKNIEGVAYIQRPWEDAEQMGWNLMRKWFSNKDGIFGLKLKTPSKLFTNITAEWIQTHVQMGPGLPDPPPADVVGDGDPTGCNHNMCYRYGTRENYDNNFIFQSGKTYYQRVIGTPLYTHQSRIINLLGTEEDIVGDVYGRNTVYNNRVKGFHLGLSGQLNTQTTYEFKYTYTKNYGNYFAEYGRGYNAGYTGWSRSPEEAYYFENGIGQSYSMVILKHRLSNSNFVLTGGLGADFGGIYDSYGGLFGISYKIL